MAETIHFGDLCSYIGQKVIIGEDTYGAFRYCGKEAPFMHDEIFFPKNSIEDSDITGSLGIVPISRSESSILPIKAPFMHDEHFSPKNSTEDTDSNESLGILPHLHSLDGETDWDDSVLLTMDNSQGLKSYENKSNADNNALMVHDLTASILSLDISSSTLLQRKDEYHDTLNTTVVLPIKIEELDECQTDLNTTMVLSNKKLEQVNQKHDKLSPFQIFACNEAVIENEACANLNSTMIFPSRSVETENKFCVDLNTTVVLNDKCEESDKNRDISSTDTVNVANSPINVLSADSPKFASTPKHEINFSFNATFQLNDFSKEEVIKPVVNEKNFAEYVSPIRSYEPIQLNDDTELKKELNNVNALIPLPALNETFDHAKFNTEEIVMQDYEESAFTCKMNIQDQNVDTLERINKPVIQYLNEHDTSASELQEKQGTFYVSKDDLNSTHDVEKAVDVKDAKKEFKTMLDIEEASDASELTQVQKGDMNILNVTHSVLGKVGNLNSPESASVYGKTKTLDTTFQKVKETDAKVTNTKALSFQRRPPKQSANRKSISHFGSSNFSNTEPKLFESRNRRNSFSSDKNALSKNDKTKIISPTSNISVSIKENNKSIAHQQNRLIDTHANVAKIDKEKNQKNIARQSSKLLCFKPTNSTKKIPKNLPAHHEKRIIIPPVDEREEITELTDAEKSRRMYSPPQTSNIPHYFSTTAKPENMNTEKCKLLKTCILKPKFKVTENVGHLKTSTQSKTETTHKTQTHRRTDALMKQPGLRKSIASVESLEKKDAALSRRSVSYLRTPATTIPKLSPSKESEFHLLRTSSRIPRRFFSRIPKPSSHPPEIAEEKTSDSD